MNNRSRTAALYSYYVMLFEPVHRRFVATISYPGVDRCRTSNSGTTMEMGGDVRQTSVCRFRQLLFMGLRQTEVCRTLSGGRNASYSQTHCYRDTTGSGGHFHVLNRAGKQRQRPGQNNAGRSERMVELFGIR